MVKKQNLNTPLRQELETYTYSFYRRDANAYSKPVPHPVWWRRWLGQTISHPKEWERVSYRIKVPAIIVQETWFQDAINVLSLGPDIKIAMGQLENMNEYSTVYIKTKGTKNG